MSIGLPSVQVRNPGSVSSVSVAVSLCESLDRPPGLARARQLVPQTQAVVSRAQDAQIRQVVQFLLDDPRPPPNVLRDFARGSPRRRVPPKVHKQIPSREIRRVAFHEGEQFHVDFVGRLEEMFAAWQEPRHCHKFIRGRGQPDQIVSPRTDSVNSTSGLGLDSLGYFAKFTTASQHDWGSSAGRSFIEM